MKKYILLCFLCCLLTEMIYAQIYIKGYTGYALSTGNERFNATEIINDKTYASSYRLKLGQGINVGLSIGYDLNKNIAFEITGNTLFSPKYKYSNSYQWDFNSYSNVWHWSYNGFFGDVEYASTMFGVSPQIVFRSNPYNQWIFYLKGGLDFVVVKFKKTTRTIPIDFPFYNSHTPSYYQTIRYSGNLSTGIQYSFGTEYKLSKNICVFAELTAVNLKYTFKRSQILQYEIDGINSLSELESTKSNDLDNQLVLNHVGFNIGIKYSLR